MSDFQKTLRDGLEQIELPYTEENLEKCQIYFELLMHWNEKMNLTAIRDEREAAVKHFLDSLLCLKKAPFGKEDHLIDVGTGAGFPGIPIKIFVPGLKLCLLDALAKRTVFLKEVVTHLNLLDTEVLHGRAEDTGQNPRYREKFTRATARAVTSLPVLLEYCLPFITPGGTFLALKGPQIEEEVEQSKKALAILGAKIDQSFTYALPISGDGRTLLSIKKTGQTPKKYPRKAGLPEKQPL